jgi:head-tail adaptor
MGGKAQTYTDVSTVWASISNINTYEQVEGFAPKGKTTFRFVTRYQPSWYAYWDFLKGSTAITDGSGHRDNPKMRFKYKNRFFRIINIMDVNEAHRWYEISCEETA